MFEVSYKLEVNAKKLILWKIQPKKYDEKIDNLNENDTRNFDFENIIYFQCWINENQKDDGNAFRSLICRIYE